MNVQAQIKQYITGQAEPKRSDLQELHRFILQVLPGHKLWFLDGKNSEGKTVSNPNIGYGLRTIKYADGKTREFYQIGLSANKTGISVYILGVQDKAYLMQTFGKTLGQASITGYCIRFKALKDINLDILGVAIRCGVDQVAYYSREQPAFRACVPPSPFRSEIGGWSPHGLLEGQAPTDGPADRADGRCSDMSLAGLARRRGKP